MSEVRDKLSDVLIIPKLSGNSYSSQSTISTVRCLTIQLFMEQLIEKEEFRERKEEKRTNEAVRRKEKKGLEKE